jgi:hypothetical protein
MVSEKSFISKKNKRTRILKKISPKNIPVLYGYGIRDHRSGKKSSRIPDPGGTTAPDPGSATLLRTVRTI